MIIYVSEDTPEGIFTMLYDAWEARIPDGELKLRVEQEMNMELFAQYRYVETDREKAVKVARSVRRRISETAYRQIYAGALSFEEDKAEVMYRFLKLGFRAGARVTDMHGDASVCRMFELWRNVTNEGNLFREFIRFSDLESGILMARIKPKNQILPLVAEHFAERFPMEHFAIIDENRAMGVFHEKQKNWFLAPIERDAVERMWNAERSREYETLWKLFFKTIAIEPRRNYKCQRTHCSLRYREYMLEFQD